MATHFSNFAWRIPWTEEPDGLQSMGSQSQTQLKQLSTRHTQDVLVMDCYRFLAYFIMIRKLFWEIFQPFETTSWPMM